MASSLVPFWMVSTGIVAAFFFLLSTFHPVLNIHECLFVAIPLSLVVTAWVTFIVSGIYGEVFLGALFAVGVMWTVIAFLGSRGALEKVRAALIAHESQTGRVSHIRTALYAFAATAFFIFGYIIVHHAISQDGRGFYTGGASYSDLAFHLGMIRSFVHGANTKFQVWDVVNPYYHNEPISYPFMSDFLSAALVKGGFAITDGIVIPSALLFVSLIALIYLFATRFTENLVATIAAVLLSSLVGGVGFVSFIFEDQFNFSKLVDRDVIERTSDGYEIFWFNLISHLTVPSRSTLFGYTVVMAVVLLLWVGTGTGLTRNQRKRVFALAGVLGGLLPIVHGHSYAALLILSLVLAVTQVRRVAQDSFYFFHWTGYFVPLIGLAIPQITMYFPRASYWGYFRWTRIWEHNNPFVFWFYALGLFVPLSFAAIYYLNNRQRSFYAGFVAIFIAGNFMQLQPWNKENLKFIYIWVFGASAAVGVLFQKMCSKRGSYQTIAIIIGVTLVFSGSLSVVRESKLHALMYDDVDIEAADYLIRHSELDSVILASSSHIHPATTIAGRSVVMSFSGWAWTQGYDFGDTSEAIKAMWKGDKKLIKDNNISWMVICPKLREGKSFDQAGIDKVANRVFDNTRYQIYQVMNDRL